MLLLVSMEIQYAHQLKYDFIMFIFILFTTIFVSDALTTLRHECSQKILPHTHHGLVSLRVEIGNMLESLQNTLLVETDEDNFFEVSTNIFYGMFICRKTYLRACRECIAITTAQLLNHLCLNYDGATGFGGHIVSMCVVNYQYKVPSDTCESP